MNQSNGIQRNAYLPLLYVAIIVLPLFLLGCYLNNEKPKLSQFQVLTTHALQEQRNEDKDRRFNDLVPLEVCDVFIGKWVLDNVTHRLYKEDECEFLPEWVACTRNGRPDSKYQKWRWQPRDCSLPRFDAKLLLENLRGKKLMFIGDSIHYNQWQSMVCMVQSIIPSGKNNLKNTAQMSIFDIEEYNTTISFYWAPFLVESNADPLDNRDGKADAIIIPQSISKHGENWKDVDFLVFNTYLWWLRHSTIKIRQQGSFTNGSKEYDEEIEIHIVYEQVLSTWTNWLEQNVNPNRTSIFFSSMSPTHGRSSDWGANGGGRKCETETEPILNMSKPIDVGTNQELFEMAVNVTKSAKVKIQFLNITKMSEYRKDAHISFYGSTSGKLITPERRYADCFHWCLPGLPDTWNELLSMYIIYKT